MTNKQPPKEPISERSSVTIGFVMFILAGVVRVESISSKATANSDKIDTLETENKEYRKVITEVQLNLREIKTEIRNLKK